MCILYKKCFLIVFFSSEYVDRFCIILSAGWNGCICNFCNVDHSFTKGI